MSDVTPGVYLAVDRDGWTKGMQLSIDVVHEDGGGHGFRICGPKYNGSSQNLIRHRLDAGEVESIKGYLKMVKP